MLVSNAIEVRNLRKIYNQVKVANDVTLYVKKKKYLDSLDQMVLKKLPLSKQYLN